MKRQRKKFFWEHQMTYIEKRAYPRLGGLLDHNIIQSIQKEVGVQVNLLTYQSLASTVWTKTLGILVVLLFSLGQTHLHLTSSYWPCNNMSNINYVDLDDTKLVNKYWYDFQVLWEVFSRVDIPLNFFSISSVIQTTTKSHCWQFKT